MTRLIILRPRFYLLHSDTVGYFACIFVHIDCILLERVARFVGDQFNQAPGVIGGQVVRIDHDLRATVLASRVLPRRIDQILRFYGYRWKTGAALNAPDMKTFYTPGPKGYTDYPELAAELKPHPSVAAI